MDNYLLVKILIIGDSGVGKSSILIRFADDEFNVSQAPTIGVDFKTKLMKVKNQNLKLALWDTAGQERFRTLTSAYYKGAQGIILVYDCSKRESFDHITYWQEEVRKYSTNEDAVIMLVANKVDLEDHQVCVFVLLLWALSLAVRQCVALLQTQLWPNRESVYERGCCLVGQLRKDPCTMVLRASHTFVYRGLTGRVSIVIVICSCFYLHLILHIYLSISIAVSNVYFCFCSSSSFSFVSLSPSLSLCLSFALSSFLLCLGFRVLSLLVFSFLSSCFAPQVSREQGEEFALANSMMFIEVSAKTRQGIQQAFEEVLYKILDTPFLLDKGAGRGKKVSGVDSNGGGGCC